MWWLTWIWELSVAVVVHDLDGEHFELFDAHIEREGTPVEVATAVAGSDWCRLARPIALFANIVGSKGPEDCSVAEAEDAVAFAEVALVLRGAEARGSRTGEPLITCRPAATATKVPADHG